MGSKAPKVVRENTRALANYYRGKKFNQPLARLAFWGCRGIFHANQNEDEGALEAAGEIVKDTNSRLMLLSAHESNADPLHLAGIATKTPLRSLIGNTMILSKPSLFKYAPLRFLIERITAVPIFRNKDSKDGTPHHQENDMLMTAYAENMEDGQHIAGFPGKERRLEKDGSLTKTTSGFGRLACKVSEEVRLFVLPIGLTYAHGSLLRPDIYIGMPYEAPRESPEVFTDRLQNELERVQTAALAARA